MGDSRNHQKPRHADLPGILKVRRRDDLADARSWDDDNPLWKTPGGKLQVRAERRRAEAAEQAARGMMVDSDSSSGDCLS
jgi:hypothetical protein